MSDKPPVRRRLTQRLGFQIAFILAVVLLPLTAISVVRSAALVNEAQARSEAALMGETVHAASRELQLIQEARGAVEVLAGSVRSVIGDDARCSAVMRDIKASSAHYTLVAYVPLSGMMTCSSSDEARDLRDSPTFKTVVQRADPTLVVNRNGSISRTSILGISHPVYDEAGAQIGFVTVSLPHNELAAPEDTPGDDSEPGMTPLELITFDADGNVLTAAGWSSGYEGSLPANRSLAALVGPGAIAFTARAENGMVRVFSVVPLVQDELYALGTWPLDQAESLQDTLAAIPLLLPALIWLASLGAAWLAVERLVIRHIKTLRTSITSFAGGNRSVGAVDFTAAPLEVQDVAEAYLAMTETILREEAELEDTVHQKEVLLREVHHRVKNNLQLIASIMNMQIRRAQSIETRATLRGLQDRVMSLATIHRELFHTAGLADVHVDELLESIVRQITVMAVGSSRKVDVKTEFAPVRLTPDQAVPAALLVAEAVTSAFHEAGSDSGELPRIEVGLHLVGPDSARLEVRHGVGAHTVIESSDAEDSLGQQLLSAFAHQLGANVDESEEGGLRTLSVTFRIRKLTEAEARRQEAAVA